MWLARLLGPQGFKQYAVAVAYLALLGTLSEFGTGKYGLKVMPHFVAQQKWSRAAGYWRFSLALVLSTSIVLALTVILLEIFSDGKFGNYAVGIAALFLPSTALVAVLAELVTANRSAVAGSLVTRLICPLITIVAVAVFFALGGTITVAQAIVCFGIGGIGGLVVAAILFWRTANPESLSSKSEYHRRDWFKQCVWYSALGFFMLWIFKISVLVMEWAQIDGLEIARFAAALEIGCFVLLVAKSTNKFYQPELALIMNQDDWQRGLVMRRVRLLTIGIVSLAFFVVILLFGKRLLELYGTEFVAGYPALCWISLGTCLATSFAMAPEYLKFSNKLKTVLSVTFLFGISLIALTWILATRYGATGAGIAFGASVSGMALVFLILANRRLYRIDVIRSPASGD